MARRRRKPSIGDIILPLSGMLAIAFWKAGDQLLRILGAVLTGFFWMAVILGGSFLIIRFLQKKKKQLELEIRSNSEQKVKLDELSIKTQQPPASKPPQLSVITLREMDWKRFELLCQGYFSACGYESRLTSSGADGGVDIILEKEKPEGSRQKIYVQCKAWSTQKVGVKAVRELFGVMAADDVPFGVFATSSSFTAEAENFAAGKKLKLISGEQLIYAISKLPKDQQESLARNALAGDYKTPTCPSCDIKMVLRTSKKGDKIGSQFWGCSNFPRCRQNLQLKKESKPKKRYF
ncbi:restriction endonuclease [Endozoicomonas ascidiicola]|uniref:restriction endonuclease n=1 Tax=Endozoicomonas ascidiicola TaxID=1698521 RepID=UPI000B246292|nr:restriction endonuclease [Endozoicomonas ascidiicola]